MINKLGYPRLTPFVCGYNISLDFVEIFVCTVCTVYDTAESELIIIMSLVSLKGTASQYKVNGIALLHWNYNIMF